MIGAAGLDVEVKYPFRQSRVKAAMEEEGGEKGKLQPAAVHKCNESLQCRLNRWVRIKMTRAFIFDYNHGTDLMLQDDTSLKSFNLMSSVN